MQSPNPAPFADAGAPWRGRRRATRATPRRRTSRRVSTMSRREPGSRSSMQASRSRCTCTCLIATRCAGTCGCNMRLARDQDQVSRYIESLIEELGLLADALPGRLSVAHLHWGGGTPTSMTPADLKDVMDLPCASASRCSTRRARDRMRSPHAAAHHDRSHRSWASPGASFGVQEFDADVQAAINRIQPPELAAGGAALRSVGVEAINFDLIYGLPLQTTSTSCSTPSRSVMRCGRTACRSSARPRAG